MTSRDQTYDLMRRLSYRGIELDFNAANTLRRAQLTLHRWAEKECGDGNDYVSWAIERDEQTGIPYMCYHRFTQPKAECYRIADLEKGALRRVKAIADAHSLAFYHQTDPRGCSLYVSKEPIADHNYTQGVAI